jgi:uncharacterized protein
LTVQRSGGHHLVAGGRVVARADVARSWTRRGRGLIGRRGLEGVLWLEPCRSVHTVGLRFAIDVAYLDAGGRVLLVRRLRPGRLGRARRGTRVVVEAEAGSFDAWGVAVGSTLTLHTPRPPGPSREVV